MGSPHVPSDIWSLVCEQIFFTGVKQDLAIMCQVSRLFHNAVIPFLYRSLELLFSFTEAPWTAMLLEVLLYGKPEYRKYVRELSATVETAKPLDQIDCTKVCQRAMISQTVLLVPLLPSLKEFKWNSSRGIPRLFVALLGEHPSLNEMGIKIAQKKVKDRMIPVELYNNPKLTSITALVRGKRSKPDNTLVELTRLLTSSPNLHTLGMNLGIGRKRIGRRSTRCLEFTETGIPITPHSLTLEQFTFEDQGPNSLQRHLNARRLNHLSLKLCRYNFHLYEVLSQHPLCIKSLELQDFRQDLPSGLDTAFLASADKFLQSFTGLERLTLTDAGSMRPLYSIDGLLHHARSLRYLKLDVTEWPLEDGFPDNNALALPIAAEHLQSVAEKCIRLEELTIYLHLGDLEERSPFIAVLRSFTALRQLTIHTPLGSYTGPRAGVRQLTSVFDHAYIWSLANRLWIPTLESIAFICDTHNWDLHDWMSHSLLYNKTCRWTASKDEQGDVAILDSYLAANKRLCRRWSKFLGEQMVPPEDYYRKRSWEEEFQKRIVERGTAIYTGYANSQGSTST